MIAALALFLAHGASLQAPETLTQYIAALHWDPAKLGPLLAVECEGPSLQERGELIDQGRKSFDLPISQRKLVKAGSLSVLAPSWTIELDESILPNPYQELDEDDKLYFLLSVLSSSELSKLYGDGLSASELTGEKKLALLSMIPQPLRFSEGTVLGWAMSNDHGPVTLPGDQRERVRLQLLKGVDVQVRSTTGNGRTDGGFFSPTYAGPQGSPGAQRAFEPGGRLGAKYPGHVTDRVEKSSELSWNDPRLNVAVPLSGKQQLEELVDMVRARSGLELYADARISKLAVISLGGTASARDLLRGLALAVDGTYRRVGPVYLLTANLEGEASREVRLDARSKIGGLETDANVDRWRQLVKSKGLQQVVPFQASDFLHPESLPPNLLATDNESQTHWIPLSNLSESVKEAILACAKAETEYVQDESLATPTEARLTIGVCYRLVLPDGLPMETAYFDDAPGPDLVEARNPIKLPFDVKALPKGSAVAIHSDEPATVAGMCARLKEFGIFEVWIDSDSPEAIRAAIDSGLDVAAIVEPWRLGKEEKCLDLDLNVSGQSGSQLRDVASAADRNRPNMACPDLADSFSPFSRGVSDHLSAVLRRIPAVGLRRIVLLDAQPPGYWSPQRGMTLHSDVGMQTVLGHFDVPRWETPLLASGYSLPERLQFLRQRHIDPVDIVETYQRQAPPSIYFDDGPLVEAISQYPGFHFPVVDRSEEYGVWRQWDDARHTALQGLLKEFVGKCRPIVKSVYVEEQRSAYNNIFELRVCDDGLSDDDAEPYYGPWVQILPINPKIAEDADGQWVDIPDHVAPLGPVCFDLRGVPAARFAAYLNHIFQKRIVR